MVHDYLKLRVDIVKYVCEMYGPTLVNIDDDLFFTWELWQLDDRKSWILKEIPKFITQRRWL